METTEIVLKVLKKSTPLKYGEIAEKASNGKKEVDKTIKKLFADEKIVSPKRCFYSAQ